MDVLYVDYFGTAQGPSPTLMFVGATPCGRPFFYALII